MDTTKYQIMKTIDAPFRLFGLTLDEAVPAMALIIVFGLLLRMMLVAIIATAVSLIAIRLLKRGRSSGFLLNAIYWQLPGCVLGSYLKRTPKSSKRHFIA